MELSESGSELDSDDEVAGSTCKLDGMEDSDVLDPEKEEDLEEGEEEEECYCLSKRLNCSHGTYSGLMTWQKRCTAGALSGTRHVVLSPPLLLIMIAVVLLNGGVNPMTCVTASACGRTASLRSRPVRV